MKRLLHPYNEPGRVIGWVWVAFVSDAVTAGLLNVLTLEAAVEIWVDAAVRVPERAAAFAQVRPRLVLVDGQVELER